MDILWPGILLKTAYVMDWISSIWACVNALFSFFGNFEFWEVKTCILFI